jgi:hypothetical protein
MGAALARRLPSLRNAMVPSLENAALKKDQEVARQIKSSLAESQALAQKLNTSYTDPTALHVGFRREEHSPNTDRFKSNEEALRHAQGLPPSMIADKSKDATLKDMPQDLIDFMNVLPELKKTPTSRPLAPELSTDEPRPLPTDRTNKVSTYSAVDPSDAVQIPGTISAGILRSILCEYHWNTPDEWGIIAGGAIPKKRSPENGKTLPPREIAVKNIAARHKISEEHVKTLVKQFNLPDPMKGSDGEVLGAWRERGGMLGQG